jgi:hypothetical protein
VAQWLLRLVANEIFAGSSPVIRSDGVERAPICLSVHALVETKFCKACQTDKPLDQMAVLHSVSGKTPKQYVRSLCTLCENAQLRRRRKEKPEVYGAIAQRQKDKNRASRAQDVSSARWILVDSKKSDRKKGLEFGLDLAFIEEQIQRPCSYCGDTKSKMSLDRIDNAIGHTKVNVVPACTRCNYVRRDMPYEAWLVVAPAMKQAREAGLFSGWLGGAKRHNAKRKG